MKENKKGFTLVELLAVIVILAIILVIAVPQIMKTIDSAREGAFSSSAKLIATSAEKEYLARKTIGDTSFEGLDTIPCTDVVKENTNDYQSCDISFDENGKATVTLVGAGKFAGKYICNGNKTSATVTEEDCLYVTLTINLGGGTTTINQAGKYEKESTIMLKEPTKEGYDFVGWEIESGNGNLVGNSLTFASSSIVINALFELSKPSYAIYSASDKSLTFLKSETPYSVGDKFTDESGTQKTVTAVYTGFETSTYSDKANVPWYSYRESITSVVVENKISPIALTNWFYGFKKCSSFDLEKLNTTHVTDMSYMFNLAGASADEVNITGLNTWDTSSVVNMAYMFEAVGVYEPTIFNIDNITNWNVSNVTNMSNMFSSTGVYATNFELDLSKWKTSSVTDMSDMFNRAGYRSTTWSIGDLSDWDVSSVTDMSYMFQSAGSSAETFDISYISNWDTSSVQNMSYMLYDVGYHSDVFELDLSNWDTSSVQNMSYMFYNVGYNATTTKINLSNWDEQSKLKNVSHMFHYTGYNSETFELNLSDWDTSGVTNASYMFNYAGYNSPNFKLVGLNTWDVSNITNITYMFSSVGCDATRLELDLSNWILSSATDMSYMFSFIGSDATKIELDLSNWIFSNSTNMRSMFYCAGSKSTSFKLIGLNTWDTSGVSDMSWMFAKAGESATNWSIGDISEWNTSNVTKMTRMFSGAGSNATYYLDLTPKEVTKNGKTYTSWDVTKVGSNHGFFEDGVDDKILSPWEASGIET